jgi:putative effector of murein hydrolase
MNPYLLTALLMLLTIGAYRLSISARKRWVSPLTTPVLFATTVIVAVMLIGRISLDQYKPSKDILTFLLGPATVALALPLYRNRLAFAREFVPAMGGLLVGTLVTITAAVLCARFFGLSTILQSTIAVKSVTVAFAVDIARIVHGDASLAAVLVVITGMLGAAFGPWILDRAKIVSPIARGISLGTIAHGQGTAQAASESEISGAVAGVGMALGGVLTSLGAPFIVPLLVH